MPTFVREQKGIPRGAKYCLRFPTLSRTESKRTRVQRCKLNRSIRHILLDLKEITFPLLFQEAVHYDPVEWIWYSRMFTSIGRWALKTTVFRRECCILKSNSRDGDTVVRNCQTDTRSERLGESVKGPQKLWGELTPVIRQSSGISIVSIILLSRSQVFLFRYSSFHPPSQLTLGPTYRDIFEDWTTPKIFSCVRLSLKPPLILVQSAQSCAYYCPHLNLEIQKGTWKRFTNVAPTMIPITHSLAHFRYCAGVTVALLR